MRRPLSLKARMLGALVAVVLPGTAALAWVHRAAMLPSFVALEQEETRRDLERCRAAYESEGEHLRRFAGDYARWDDTYTFLADPAHPDPKYVESNFQVETFTENRLDAIWIVARDGTVAYGLAPQEGTLEPVPMAELPAGRWPSDHPLLGTPPDGPGFDGLLMTTRGPLLVGSMPVTHSDGSGDVRGRVVMGRLLTTARFDELARTVRVPFQVTGVPEASATPEGAALLATLGATSGPLVRALSDDLIAGHLLLKDVRGEPALLLGARLPRDVTKRGEETIRTGLVLAVLIGVVLLLVLQRVLGRAVVRPVADLGAAVRHLAAVHAADPAARVPEPRVPEVGALARDVNVFLASLERLEGQLRTAQRTAEAASSAKGAFVATMSHELRTPLNGILGMTECLLRSPLSADQRRLAETVRGSGEVLLSLIGDVLDFSKIEAGKIELERIDLDLPLVVEQAARLVAVMAEAKGLELWIDVAPDVPRRLLGDPTRLRQVLANLLGNAIKFTARGRVTVEAQLEDAGPDAVRVRLAVSDTGAGIPPERLARLFQPYVQADASTARHHGGTGLGLAISRRLVEAMGGRAGVASTLGEGSTFWCSVPLARGVGGDEAPGAARGRRRVTVATATGGGGAVDAGTPAERPERPLTILLVDDNAVNREVGQRLVGALGHTVTTAGDGAEALARLGRQAFDVVLMDVQMPEMDGLEATQRLRAREAGTARRTPVVALTAMAFREDRERCAAAGMDHYLAKPLRLEELRRVLAEIVPATTTAPPAPTAAGAPLAPDDPFDLSHLGLPPDATAELARDVARAFLESAPGQVAALRSAAEAGDVAGLARTAHTLKGACRNLRAPEATQALSEMEAAARTGDLGGARSRLDAAERGIAALLVAAAALAQPALQR